MDLLLWLLPLVLALGVAAGIVRLLHRPAPSEDAITRRMAELDEEDQRLNGIDPATLLHGKWPHERRQERARAIASLRRTPRWRKRP